jgi:hypothetical protein
LRSHCHDEENQIDLNIELTCGGEEDPMMQKLVLALVILAVIAASRAYV